MMIKRVNFVVLNKIHQIETRERERERESERERGMIAYRSDFGYAVVNA